MSTRLAVMALGDYAIIASTIRAEYPAFLMLDRYLASMSWAGFTHWLVTPRAVCYVPGMVWYGMRVASDRPPMLKGTRIRWQRARNGEDRIC